MPTKNYGLILEPLKPEDYVFGGFVQAKGQVLQPDGQWDDFLPNDEFQAALGYETSACVTFATLNAVEILKRRIWTRTDNYSDRFLAKVSGTTPTGNSFYKVQDTLRHSGVVLEYEWPTASALTYEEFFQAPPAPLYLEALEFTAEFEYQYDYVPLAPTNIKAALQYSPLTFGVYAWTLKPGSTDTYYMPPGELSNHAVVCYGYVEGSHWKIFDTYDNTHKKLDWKSLPAIAFRHTLIRQIVNEPAFFRFLAFIRQLIGL